MTPSTKVVTVIAGQGAAPRLATLEHFKGPAGIPARGIEAAAVPAALDACLTLLDRFGTMTFTQVIAPTQELLRAAGRGRSRGMPILRGRSRRSIDAEAQAASQRLGLAGRPTARAGCDWSPTRSTADRSPAASTPGRRAQAG